MSDNDDNETPERLFIGIYTTEIRRSNFEAWKRELFEKQQVHPRAASRAMAKPIQFTETGRVSSSRPNLSNLPRCRPTTPAIELGTKFHEEMERKLANGVTTTPRRLRSMPPGRYVLHILNGHTVSDSKYGPGYEYTFATDRMEKVLWAAKTGSDIMTEFLAAAGRPIIGSQITCELRPMTSGKNALSWRKYK